MDQPGLAAAMQDQVAALNKGRCIGRKGLRRLHIDRATGGQHALKRWPELIAPLSEPVFFQQNGTLVLWHRQDAAEAKRFEQLLHRTQQQLPSLPAAQTLNAEGLQERQVRWRESMPDPE